MAGPRLKRIPPQRHREHREKKKRHAGITGSKQTRGFQFCLFVQMFISALSKNRPKPLEAGHWVFGIIERLCGEHLVRGFEFFRKWHDLGLMKGGNRVLPLRSCLFTHSPIHLFTYSPALIPLTYSISPRSSSRQEAAPIPRSSRSVLMLPSHERCQHPPI